MARTPVVYNLSRRPTVLILERLPNGGYIVVNDCIPGTIKNIAAGFSTLDEALAWMGEQMKPRPDDGAPITEGLTDGN